MNRIIHYGAAKNIGIYFQAIGSAGRDEKQSKAITFFYNKNFLSHEYFIKKTISSSLKNDKPLEIILVTAQEALAKQSNCKPDMVAANIVIKQMILFKSNLFDGFTLVKNGTLIDFTSSRTLK